MRVRVLYFGILKDLAEAPEETIRVLEGISVRGLLEILRARTSNNDMGERVWQTVAVAVNREYASPDAMLCDGDEVALLPPVSGGASPALMRGGLDGLDAD